MTQDEIIAMAREAGFSIIAERYLAAHQCTTADIERFAALVAANERERTKDLTDYELHKIRANTGSEISFARSVISAYEEKNK